MHRLKEREREIITLTDEEFEDFDFIGGYIRTEWEIQNEIYKYVDEINTAAHSDGDSWNIVVQRDSDKKFFVWGCWNSSESRYKMSPEKVIKQVFPKETIFISYE